MLGPVVLVVSLAACAAPVAQTVAESAAEPVLDSAAEGSTCRADEDAGRLSEAEAACQRALELARRDHARPPPATAAAGPRTSSDPAAQTYSMRLYNLARIKRKLGKFAEARTLYRRSLDIEEGVSGPTSTWVGRRLIEAAIVEGQMGRWTEGAVLLERALPIAARLPTGDRTTTARVTGEFIGVLRARGDSQQAERLSRAASTLGVPIPSPVPMTTRAGPAPVRAGAGGVTRPAMPVLPPAPRP